MTEPAAAPLVTRYEAFRTHVLDGQDRAALGVAVVRRQGLSVWMTLVDAEERAAARVAPGDPPASPPRPASPPPLVRSALLAAFADLVIGAAVGVQEVS